MTEVVSPLPFCTIPLGPEKPAAWPLSPLSPLGPVSKPWASIVLKGWAMRIWICVSDVAGLFVGAGLLVLIPRTWGWRLRGASATVDAPVPAREWIDRKSVV